MSSVHSESSSAVRSTRTAMCLGTCLRPPGLGCGGWGPRRGRCLVWSLPRNVCERQAGSLQRQHPGAATALLEGLAEALTLQRLGVRGAFYRTLRSTNPVGWTSERATRDGSKARAGSSVNLGSARHPHRRGRRLLEGRHFREGLRVEGRARKFLQHLDRIAKLKKNSCAWSRGEFAHTTRRSTRRALSRRSAPSAHLS